MSISLKQDLSGIVHSNLIYAFNWGSTAFSPSDRTAFTITNIYNASDGYGTVYIKSSGLYYLIVTCNDANFDIALLFYYDSALNSMYGLTCLNGTYCSIRIGPRNVFTIGQSNNSGINLSLNIYKLSTLTINPAPINGSIFNNQTSANAYYRNPQQ